MAVVMERIVPRVLPAPVVSAAMMRAGRSAFEDKRAVLNDLFDCFECDLDEFLGAIYLAMNAAQRVG